MKSFPETGFGNFESSLNSLVASSPSLLQQMSQLQSAGQGGSIKFPELSITKHEGPGPRSEDHTTSSLQITPKSNPSTMVMSGSESGGLTSCRQDVRNNMDNMNMNKMDIQEQINMLRNMPDFMMRNNSSINHEEEEISGEEIEEEEGSPSSNHKVNEFAIKAKIH